MKDGQKGRRKSLSLRRLRVFLGRLSNTVAFSSLTRRIVFLNVAALAVLVLGILYLNQFRDGLIDAASPRC